MIYLVDDSCFDCRHRFCLFAFLSHVTVHCCRVLFKCHDRFSSPERLDPFMFSNEFLFSDLHMNYILQH